MFAVVVLGIGFIMAAAIFPVAIKQSQLNTEETAAVAVARNGVNVMTELAGAANPSFRGSQSQPQLVTDSLLVTTDVPVARVDADLLPPNTSIRLGKVVSMKDRRIPNGVGNPRFHRRDGMWKAVAGNMVQPGDPRYAWTVLYRRDVLYTNTGGPARVESFPFAQLFLIGCTSRARPTFQVADVIAPPTGTDTAGGAGNDFAHQQYFPLEPKPVAVRVLPLDPADAAQGYFIQFFSVRGLSDGGGFNVPANLAGMYEGFARDAVAEGSFVIISDDRIIAPGGGGFGNGASPDEVSRNTGRLNGKVLRVGARLPERDETGANPKYAWTLEPGLDFSPDTGDDGRYFAGGGAGVLRDDINVIGVDGLATFSWNGIPTSGSDIRVAGNAAQKGAVAFIVGRSFTVDSPNNPLPPGAPGSAAQYEGATQDVAVYTTFVPVR